jgi:hypothetical protein
MERVNSRAGNAETLEQFRTPEERAQDEEVELERHERGDCDLSCRWHGVEI